MSKRKRYNAQFKAQIAIQALQGEKTINELAAEYEIHPNQIAQWKKHLIEASPDIFSGGKAGKNRSEEGLRDRLYQEIGKLKVELEFLKKKVRI
jgi:transposase-like protein